MSKVKLGFIVACIAFLLANAIITSPEKPKPVNPPMGTPPIVESSKEGVSVQAENIVDVRKDAESDKRSELPDFKDLHAGQSKNAPQITLENIPEWSGKPYIVINRNIPFLTADDETLETFQRFSDFDGLGRCGAAFVNVCMTTIPTEKRRFGTEFAKIRPTGFHSVRYDDVIDDRLKYLYNRCHLIAYQLSGQILERRNLITGTRYLNIKGMLPFENLVKRHVERHRDHILYRVTPIFKGNELVARGVLIEARSVETHGRFHFCVYVYNVQPGIVIDYATGKSRRA